jgi:hypothetical protein
MPEGERDFHLGDAAALQIQIGDIVAATETIRELPPMHSIAIDRLGDMAAARIRAGDLAAALQYADAPVAGLSPEEEEMHRSLILGRIMRAQIEIGDLTRAQQTVASIPHAMTRASALAELSVAQFRAQDTKAAAKSLAQASKLGSGMEAVQVDIARAQAKSGDFASALITINALQEHPYSSKPGLLMELSQVATSAHRTDISEAMLSEAFGLVSDSKDDLQWRMGTVQEIASIEAKVGSFAAALKMAATLPDRYRSHALWKIGLEQAKAGDINGAEQTVAGLDFFTFAIPEIAVAKARRGDFTYALKLSDVNRYRVLQTIFSEKAKSGDLAEAVSLVTTTMRTPAQKTCALLGIAEGLLGTPQPAANVP